MRWIIYNILFFLAYILMLPRFWWRMWRRGGYSHRFADRFGKYPENIREQMAAMHGPVWIHAVSVGEVYVAGQMMRALRQALPTLQFVLSTTSSTGWKIAETQLSPDDVLIYNPVDFTPWVKRALAVIKPAALILTESELWPNLLRHAHLANVPLFLINARVSDRSAPGYRFLRLWFGPVLRMFSAIMAQSELDKERLVAAGADPAVVEVTGSFKFDVAQRSEAVEKRVARFLEQCGCGTDTVILLGGSTWPGEEQIMLDVFGQLSGQHPQLRLVIVPRHFERADAVEAEIVGAGMHCVRKSRFDANSPPHADVSNKDVILADTTGELMGFYANSDIAFVGKTLCNHGGQNMIEPCLCGVAVVLGPNVENFRPVVADLLHSEALVQVDSAADLQQVIAGWLDDPALRLAVGVRATAAVQRRKGVVDRCAAKLLAYLPADV